MDYLTFIFDVRLEIEAAGYSLELIEQEEVSIPNSSGTCSGFFDDKLRLIRVATSRPLEIWLGVLVHELCHFRQFKEQAPCTLNYTIKGKAADEYIDAWFDYKEELSNEDLLILFGLVKDIELDCEKRSVDLISQYKLPIDVSFYTQMANAYVLSHNLMLRKREFIKRLSKVPEVRNLPDYFLSDYSTTNYDHILELLF